MNGVRRLLNGGTPAAQESILSPSSSPPRAQPLSIPMSTPSWPPQSPLDTTLQPSLSPAEPAKTTTAALFFRKDKQKPVSVPSTDEGHAASPVNGRKCSPFSPALSSPLLTRKAALSDTAINKTARDDLLITLLSSEALVESREYEVLTAEEVDGLKKVGVAYPHFPYFPCLVICNVGAKVTICETFWLVQETPA
jgi:hypothetical protein